MTMPIEQRPEDDPLNAKPRVTKIRKWMFTEPMVLKYGAHKGLYHVFGEKDIQVLGTGETPEAAKRRALDAASEADSMVLGEIR